MEQPIKTNGIAVSSDNKWMKMLLKWLVVSSPILFGYGYMQGLGSPFGFSATMLLPNAADIALVAIEPLVIVFNKLANMATLKKLVIDNLMNACSFAIAAFLLFLVFNRYFRTAEKKAQTRAWLAFWLVKIKALVLVEKPSKRRVGIESIVIALLVFCGQMIITLSIFVAYIVACVFVLWVPVIGYSAGKSVAYDDIITPPKECAPYLSAIKKTQKFVRLVNCVRILKDEAEITRGRLIAVNSERIFLYVPKLIVDENAKRTVIHVPVSMPLQDVVIEQVETEFNPTLIEMQ